MAKPRIKIIEPVAPRYTARTYYEMTPLQQSDADRLIIPIAQKNYITPQTMARCVREWLLAGKGTDLDPVIGWIHPSRGALLFRENAAR